MAITIVALLEPREIARQIDFEHGTADFAQSRRRPIQVRIPAAQIGEQEDHLLHVAFWQDQR
jgi:hypothetical protein